METKEWTFVDKSGWKRGPWDNEPDKKQWTDEATGLPCLIRRGPSGALCGYVGVSEGHPYFEKDYSQRIIPFDPEDEDEDEDYTPYDRTLGGQIDIHGGLTFSAKCSPHKEGDGGICHEVCDGEDDNVWWLGFDCAHSWDVVPAYGDKFISYDACYKGLRYVESECAKLASQLAAKATQENRN